MSSETEDLDRRFRELHHALSGAEGRLRDDVRAVEQRLREDLRTLDERTGRELAALSEADAQQREGMATLRTTLEQVKTLSAAAAGATPVPAHPAAGGTGAAVDGSPTGVLSRWKTASGGERLLATFISVGTLATVLAPLWK